MCTILIFISNNYNCINKNLIFTLLKFTNIILSLIILLISSMPCADLEVNSFAHSSEKFISNNENHSHDEENDLCSPFCICSCCGSQMASYSQSIVIDFPIPSKDIKTLLPSYKSIFTSNFYGSIWQPPQIA